GDEHAEPQELIGGLRCLDSAKERLQRLARPARIPRDPGGHGELIVGRAAAGCVGQLAGEALRDGQRLDRLAAALEKIEGRAGVQPYSSGVAHRETSRVERLLGAAQRLRSRCECEEARDRTDLEFSLATRTLKIGVVEERSEERRVGKECRSRWWRAHVKETRRR